MAAAAYDGAGESNSLRSYFTCSQVPEGLRTGEIADFF